MRVAVIGVGHVGLVTAACLARWGHDVIGMDDDEAKVESLTAGNVPFYEPGLQELVTEGVDGGRLRFTGSRTEALDGTEIAFVCVGTPGLPGGAPNLAYVEQVGVEAAQYATGDLILVEKSTVPANTGVRLRQVIQREQARHGATHTISVASNPEFLKEGSAVHDTLYPDRLVIGAAIPSVAERVRDAYQPMLDGIGDHPAHDCPVVLTDLQTAELIKHASNAFLATKISFINAVARVCDLVGADVSAVADGMGLDQRIGRQFLYPGLGYGGSCFPKDVDAFVHLASSVGYDFKLLEEVRAINVGMRDHVLDLLRQELWHVEGKVVTLLGAAFKPGTDDLREAPAIHLARALVAAGATVRIYDPVAIPNVDKLVGDLGVVTFTDPIEALRDAHATIICTEWPQVRALTPADFSGSLGYPIVIDGRNVFDPATMVAAGLHYHSIGRPRGGPIPDAADAPAATTTMP